MTQDEAIKIIDHVYSQPHRGGLSEGAIRVSAASGLADALVALGLLKLDAPPTVESEACELLNRAIGMIEASNAIGCLYANGFKIVKA